MLGQPEGSNLMAPIFASARANTQNREKMNTVKPYESVLLVSLSISGILNDTCKAESDAIEKAANANHKSAKAVTLGARRFSINPEVGELLKKARSLATDLRGYHNKLCAWSDSWRCIKAVDLPAYREEVDAREAKLANVFNEFCDVYAAERENLIAMQEGVANARKFPSAEDLRKGFGVSRKAMRFPTTDFRALAGLTPEIRSMLENEAKNSLSDTFRNVQKELLSRIIGDERNGLMHFVLRVKAIEEDSKFHSSAVTKLGSLYDEVIKANVFNDETVNCLAEKLKTFAQTDIFGVKTSSEYRENIVKDGSKVLSEVIEATEGL